MFRYPYFFPLLGILLLTGLAACRAASPFEGKEYNPVVTRSYNHTVGSINWYSVNGLRGSGGENCCVMLPIKWRPGLKARVEWEMDPNPREKLPSPSSDEWNAAYKAHSAKYKQYQAVADIPPYPDNQTCGLQVHFLTCGRIKVTATCIFDEDPAYPIQDTYRQIEPKSCPASPKATPQ